MGIAVVATLISVRDTAHQLDSHRRPVWRIGVMLGVPPAQEHQDDRDAAAGRAVQRCRWRHRRADRVGRVHRDRRVRPLQHEQHPTVALVVGSLFAAIIGSVSFWGSLVAFLKLQESMPEERRERHSSSSAKLFQAATWCCCSARSPRRSTSDSTPAGGQPRLDDRAGAGARPGSWVCSWCCRSAAPTCPSSSRCSTR